LPGFKITQESRLELNPIDFIQLYYDPRNLLERVFKMKWKHVANDVIYEIRQDYEYKVENIK
jgi:hypothetical protein